MALSELQEQVVNEAKNRLKGKPWFRGICMDNIPDDDEIKHGFESAVVGVMFETAYWDDPEFHG